MLYWFKGSTTNFRSMYNGYKFYLRCWTIYIDIYDRFIANTGSQPQTIIAQSNLYLIHWKHNHANMYETNLLLQVNLQSPEYATFI